MTLYLQIAGCGLTLAGALVLALADLWFSRSVLVYLDALETSLLNLIQVLQQGGSRFVPGEMDLARDRGQNRARFLKLVGWSFLILGFACHLALLVLGISSRPSPTG